MAENGHSGVLVPPNDDRSLAVALKVLLDDSGTRARLGANAQNYVQQRFSVEEIVLKYERVYDLVLADNRLPPCPPIEV